MPGAYSVYCRNTVEQSGLARAGSAHNTDIFATLYMEADVVERLCNSALAAVIFFDMFYSKQGCWMIWIPVHVDVPPLCGFVDLFDFYLTYRRAGMV